MAYELLQRSGQYITPFFRRQMAKAMDTNEQHIMAALDRLLPALLLAMAEEGRRHGTAFLLEESAHVARSGFLDNVGTFFGSQGTFGLARPAFMQRIVRALPGGGITAIATTCGLSLDDTGTLAGLITPVCLLALRDVAGNGEERGFELNRYIEQQLPALQKAALPATAQI